MHVVASTDGSRQSLRAARHLKSFADPLKISDVSVIAGIRPRISDTVLVGSTAQRVQHYAPCPVLVVRPAKKRATRK